LLQLTTLIGAQRMVELKCDEPPPIHVPRRRAKKILPRERGGVVPRRDARRKPRASGPPSEGIASFWPPPERATLAPRYCAPSRDTDWACAPSPKTQKQFTRKPPSKSKRPVTSTGLVQPTLASRLRALTPSSCSGSNTLSAQSYPRG